MTRVWKVGTRGSPLALAQTDEVLRRIRVLRPDKEFRTVTIKTHGDEGYGEDLGTPADGKRAFTKRIEEALLAGSVDFAVHSLKDLPAEPVDGLRLAAIPPRQDPRDVLVAADARSMDELREGARIGTSSLRRRAQILARWPHLRVVELRGNLGTRIRRLDGEEFDAVVVAAAGLHRLGMAYRIAQILSPEDVLPAPGQGALAVESRDGDGEAARLLAAVDDPTARTATEAERLLTMRMGGGCRLPFGALATLEGGAMRLMGAVASVDGRRVVRSGARGAVDRWPQLVDEVAGSLLRDGAGEILQDVTR